MLTDLQQRVAQILAALPEASGFVLAGGAALVARGDVDRTTRDLDFFAIEPGDVDRLVPPLRAALETAGLTVDERQVVPGFARITVTGNDESTVIDLASDARLLPPEPSRFGPALSAEELAVDKVLAVFGRAEARDFVDLAALEPRFGLERLCRLAAEKDRGFHPDAFRDMLDRFDRLPRDEFDVGDEALGMIGDAVRRWRDQLEDESPR